MLNLTKAFELIDQNLDKGYADVSGPKTETLIKAAEDALGLKFPPTYREYLKRYGYVGMGGFQACGVFHENFDQSGASDTVWLTLKKRKFENFSSPEYCLPHHLIIIASGVFAGEYYALDTSQKNTDLENPVVIWNAGSSTIDDKLEKIAEDFGDFLLQEIEAALKSEEDT